MTIQDLLQRKGELAAQAQELIDAAPPEGMRAEDEAKFEALHVDIEKLTKQIEMRARQEATMASLTDSAGRRSEPTEPGREPRTSATRPANRLTPMEHFEGLRAWFLAGSDQERTPEMRDAASRAGINLDQKQIHLRLPRLPLPMWSGRSVTQDHIRDWETRAQGVATGGAGGFTVPDETMRSLEVAMLTFGGMRQVATVIRTDSGAQLPFPTVNDTTQTGALLSENAQVANQDVTFAQLVLEAYKYSSKQILISVELLQDNAVNIANFLGEALGTRIGRIVNTHTTVGTGSSQPNGIVTASTLGKAGATGQTASIIYDDFVDLEHSVDPSYRRMGAGWMFHDLTLRAIKKIKVPQFTGDTQGQPLWQPGLAVGSPDTILGYPYTINQDVPVMAASAKSVLFGALSKYLIRDVRDITLLRLDERFADFHQVAFLAFSRHDGDLLNAGTTPVRHYANSAS